MGRRPKMTTREELIAYLEAHKDREFAFNEEMWEKAVEWSSKPRKTTTIVKTDQDGNTKTKKVPHGSATPVGRYFQLMALPQNRKSEPVEPFDPYNEEEEEEQSSPVKQLEFDEEDEQEEEGQGKSISELVSMFFSSGYNKAEQKIARDRLADYYNNYAINDGADKMLVIKAVSDEIQIMRLNAKRANGSKVDKDLDTVQKGYISLLESLKATKKTRSSTDEQGGNKFTTFLDELEKSGEFKPHFIDYHDDIDEMVKLFRDSIVRTLGNG